MELLLERLLDLPGSYVLQAHDEPFEKIACFPPEIIIIEYPCLEQGAFMDMFGYAAMERDQDVEHALVEVLDMFAAVRELQVGVQARIAQVLEQRALVQVIHGEKVGHRHWWAEKKRV